MGVGARNRFGLAGLAGTVAAAVLLLTAGCKEVTGFEPPPRANDTISVPVQNSVIAVPISADISGLKRELERAVPKTLWSINRRQQTCVASEKVKVAFVKVKTPTIKCDLVGQVTRGAMRIEGRGQQVVVTMPITARVSARDIGGVLKQETATGRANVRAVATLSVDGQWNPRGKVDIQYDWTDEPHVELLGQRVEFTSKADEKLRGIVARIERTLPRELEKLQLRREVESLWRKAFTSLELNRANPPVWMRITPQQLQYGGFDISGNTLNLRLGLKAQTETFVGDRPPNPPSTPLPPRAPLDQKPGKLTFFIPVIADYAQLEPVLMRALTKRQQRPFDVPTIGLVDARFQTVEVYGTDGGKIAVGVTFSAEDRDKTTKAKGTVWLTGLPRNEPNSRKVRFEQVTITGDTDHKGADLLLAMASAPGFASTIGSALAQNFERDYDELMAKVSRAIDSKREGDLLIRAKIDEASTGEIKAAGQGLYLPVTGTGTASITFAPR